MNIQQAIQAVIDKQDLDTSEMTSVMRQIMTGEATPAQIGGFLVGLHMKGESIEEIAAAAAVMRELATGVQVSGEHLVDIVGTGGDASSSFNVSTACTFVVAAAGGKVAKHGNRSVSSKSGSADLLEAAGVNLDLNPEQVATCINEVGVGFMFAPKHHSAMKHAIGPRKEMAVRTLFNVLGPLTNPAGVSRQLMGVFADNLVEPLAHVLQRLGSEHVMVVHGEDGMDEISISASTHIAELKEGEVREYFITPEQFGFERAGRETLAVADAQQSLEVIQGVLDGKTGPARDIVLLNAGAAIYVAGLVDDMQSGIDLARVKIDNGEAKQRLDALVARSQSF